MNHTVVEAEMDNTEKDKKVQLFIRLSALSGLESNYDLDDCNRIKGSFG